MKQDTEKFIEEKTFLHEKKEAIYLVDLQEIFEKELQLLETAVTFQTKRIYQLTEQLEYRVTLRDQFALRALEGLILKEGKEILMDVHDIVKLSYLIADQMLEAREKNQK